MSFQSVSPSYRRSLAALLLAMVLAIASPGALAAAAQTRIGLNGGRPSEWPVLAQILASQGLTQEGWLSFASQVGENWLPGTSPVPVDHPGQLGVVSGPAALTADQSAAVGRQLLHEIILRELANGSPVAVAGLSEGTLVIDQELAYLARDPNAPPAQDITFYVFGDMLRGLGQTYLPGVTIPFIGQTFGPVPESQYHTVVVNEQWDGWANPPDRPWNVLSVVNAIMGAVYTVNGSNDHSQTSLDSVSDAVLVSETVNSLGGTTSTYLVPRAQLPITRPLLQLGVPRPIVDEIDKLLTPLILTGYSSVTPQWGPHIERGQLVFGNPPAPTIPATPMVQAIEQPPAGTALARVEPSPSTDDQAATASTATAAPAAAVERTSETSHRSSRRVQDADSPRESATTTADEPTDDNATAEPGKADEPERPSADAADSSSDSKPKPEPKPSAQPDRDSPAGAHVSGSAGADSSSSDAAS